MCPLWFAQRSVEPMRRTLAALALAIIPPLAVLPIPSVQAQQVVVVRSGETLSEIAARHGVSLTRLMQANGIQDADLVVEGQRLTIPGGGSSAPAAAAASRPTQGTAPYTVKSGETLSEIAARFNTTTERLIQINAIRDPNLVMSGTRLQVPMPAQRSTPSPAAAPAAAAVNRDASTHVVQPGESLSVIAERYGTSVGRLVALNQLADPELVMVGTRLKLRGTPPPPRSTPQPAAQPSPRPPATAAPAPAAAPATALAATATAATTAATTAAAAAAKPPAPTQQPASASQPAPGQASPAQTATVQAQASAGPLPTAQPAASQPAAAKPLQPAQATPSPAVSQAPAANVTPKPTPARPAGDWRNYGPLQVDWSKIQPMGGSYVAPSLNSDGQALYLAVNCTARKINVTSQAGQWRTWETPSKDFEFKLIEDICQANRS
jgi:LysM repeat protein